MLMARPPPNGNVRNGHVPSPISLPSFETFCANLGQPEPAPPTSARLPTTSPAEYSRNPVPESPRYPPSYGQVPYSPRHAEHHQQVQSARPPEPPRTPQYPQPPWNYPHQSHATLPIQPSQSGYPEPFSPARQNQDVQQHTKVVIQERVVDGKGLCYVYSDGTTCPKLINGDTVNPKWGTTKAGKPRKRLGQACNTCREKKIRCDPQLPKCAQCQKFGRECKFETSARGSQRGVRGSSAEDSSPPSDRRESVQHDRPSSSGSFETYHERGYSTSSIAIDNLLSTRAAPGGDVIGPPAKRRKYSASPNPSRAELDMTSPTKPTLHFSASVNPFDVDAPLAQFYFGLFMQHFNGNLYPIYPQEHFRRWATSGPQKSSGDIMLLYSILALGAVFAGRSSGKAEETHGSIFEQAAEEAVSREMSRPSIHLAQTLLFLGCRKLAKGNVFAARDATSFAMRVCTGLRLNCERHDGVDAVRSSASFGLDDSTFDECCRRTFWVAYILDTTMQYCQSSNTTITDIHGRLCIPSQDQLYEESRVISQPLANLQGSYTQDIPASRTMSRLAVFANGMSIIRELMHSLDRVRHMSKEEAAAAQNTLQQTLLSRAEGLYSDICEIDPRRKKPAKEGLQGKVGTSKEEPREAFILYHFVKMIIFRHVRHDCMTPEQQRTNVTGARSEAFRLLNLLWKLRNNIEEEDATACPVAGYALFLAIDITTAAGSVASTLEHLTGEESRHRSSDPSRHERTGTGSNKAFTDLLTCGIGVLSEYSVYWETAKQQLAAVKERFTAIKGEITWNAARKPGFFFQNPLHSPFGKDMDIMYGLDKIALFQALGMADRVHSTQEDLYEVKGTQTR